MQATTTRIALVTGANKGIGFEIARQIGKAGTFVLLGARDAALGQAAAATLAAEDIDVRFIPLDVCEPETIAAAASFDRGGIRAARRAGQQCRHQRPE